MNENTAYTTYPTHSLATKGLSDCVALIVDDELSSCLLISTILQDLVQCRTLQDSSQLFETYQAINPDIIIMDINMPGKNGIELCVELKRRKHTAHCPVLFISSDGESEVQNKCWQAGASDFVKKPVVASTLVHRVKNLLQSKLRLELLTELTFRDPLTQLYNRHYLDSEIPVILRHLVREHLTLSVIMLDIDNFKNFNDVYGHIEGDNCLRQVADTLQAQLHRPQDTLVRFGGEEFLVFLPDTNEQGCLQVGNNMVEAVSALTIPALTIPIEASTTGLVTISAGYITTLPNPTSTLGDLFQQADRNLYRAKHQGKNRLVGEQVPNLW